MDFREKQRTLYYYLILNFDTIKWPYFYLKSLVYEKIPRLKECALQRLTCLISIRNDLGLRGNIFKMLHMAHNALENQFLEFFLPNNQNSFGLKMLPSSPRSFRIPTRHVRCCRLLGILPSPGAKLRCL